MKVSVLYSTYSQYKSVCIFIYPLLITSVDSLLTSINTVANDDLHNMSKFIILRQVSETADVRNHVTLIHASMHPPVVRTKIEYRYVPVGNVITT